MSVDVMVHKLNQIALFFESYERDEAIERIAAHLRRFWVPRDRRQIVGYVQHGGGGLRELAAEAVLRLDEAAAVTSAQEVEPQEVER